MYDAAMPKVTEEHRAARRRQITVATLRCVEREGFHKTTMSHVIAESGLSAGAVYTYFKSKQDLIRAIAETALAEVGKTVTALADAAVPVPPGAAVQAVAARMVDLGEEVGVDLPRVALQCWAEAARDPDLRTALAENAGQLRDSWAAYAAKAIAAGQLPASADPARVANALMALLPGFALQRLLLGLSPEEVGAGITDLLGDAVSPR